MPSGHETRPATGYLHPAYARSLAEFGNPRPLPRSGGWILEREIPDASIRDGMGCYPLFACRDWAELQPDLQELAATLVCVCVVTDPFGSYDEARLRDCFPDLVLAFKDHFIFDLSRAMRTAVSQHHRYYAARALREITVEVCEHPPQWLGTWAELYRTLVEQRDIRGMPRFSRQAFAGQIRVPGLVMFRAERHDAVVGMTLWYIQGEVAYYHLSACSELGYSLGASYGLMWRAVEFFQTSGLVALDLGGSAGLTGAADGLTRFKRGWATGQRPAFLCGRIFDRERYDALTTAAGRSGSSYFPAYREGEFGVDPSRPRTAGRASIGSTDSLS